MMKIVPHLLSIELKPSALIPVALPATWSKIVQQNGGMVYCFVYQGLKGLFRKDVEETRLFGRRLCDTVAAMRGNRGFFTTDELPRYALSEKESDLIFETVQADKAQDLVVILAYPHAEAVRTQGVLQGLLRQEQDHC